MTNDENDAAILAWLDQEDRYVTETIRKHGCYLEYGSGDGRDPSFAYTVGLFGLGHPELRLNRRIAFLIEGLRAPEWEPIAE